MKYLDNQKFLEEIKKYQKGNKTENFGKMILLISRKYAERGCFSGYSWKDDMIAEAALTCIKYINSFDVKKANPNPFAYFSKIIHNAFLNYIAKQKKHSSIKDTCYKNMELFDTDQLEDNDLKYFNISSLDYECIRGGEKNKRRKRKK
jgi:DNA-directed RNA polymerase specialized sigma24 family protein